MITPEEAAVADREEQNQFHLRQMENCNNEAIRIGRIFRGAGDYLIRAVIHEEYKSVLTERLCQEAKDAGWGEFTAKIYRERFAIHPRIKFTPKVEVTVLPKKPWWKFWSKT